MRIFPVIAAIAVVTALYLVIFQRTGLKEAMGIAPQQVAGQVEETTPSSSSPSSGDIAKGASVIAVETIARDIESAVVVRGRTEASRRVQIRAETSGQVISERANKGSTVAQDDILCQLDPGTREASLAEARARLAEARARAPEAAAGVSEAQARLDEALINLNAAEKLSQDGFASDTRVANARVQVEAAKAGVIAAQSGAIRSASAIQSAKASSAAALRELDRTVIRAPFGGLLETDTAERGALLQPGSACASIIQLNPIRLVGFVPELMVDIVDLGSPATARLANGEEISGVVTYVADSSDPETRTFRVEIEAENGEKRLREGRTVEISIAAPGRQAHLLPQSALTLDDDGHLGVRIVTDAGRAGFARVEMLRDSPEGVWVTGLRDRATVIVSGQHYVTDGVLLDVTLQDKDA
ncbi:membrane fusion protein, multidrug efflux system [Aliiroseovarius crassostreae]|uniref:Hemolysin D n=1 Tax=Aliiroseovarius crassostreae TaxID=154981 RepID=A0A0P7JLR9_9RHOB|nr:efflux RND transporter periplasmic adaptor subunit [Aliiroseovarius crassostreae]KPN62021.1 hemolysin D [Aliiroseovarius crassostreae]SFU80608.1 membrane fusion protein, multidrug efflux system [Aliiroseovarius crassostreae]